MDHHTVPQISLVHSCSSVSPLSLFLYRHPIIQQSTSHDIMSVYYSNVHKFSWSDYSDTAGCGVERLMDRP